MNQDYWTFATQGVPIKNHLTIIGKQIRSGIFKGEIVGLGWWGVNISCAPNTNGLDYIARMIEEGRYTGIAFEVPTCEQCSWVGPEAVSKDIVRCRYENNRHVLREEYCAHFRNINAENISH